LRAGNQTNRTDYRNRAHKYRGRAGLLGAILVNNEALYRVSGFSQPEHFFERSISNSSILREA